jgi:hypothetical protein
VSSHFPRDEEPRYGGASCWVGAPRAPEWTSLGHGSERDTARSSSLITAAASCARLAARLAAARRAGTPRQSRAARPTLRASASAGSAAGARPAATRYDPGPASVQGKGHVIARWRSLEDGGLEHLWFEARQAQGEDAYAATGYVIGGIEQPWLVRYRVHCDQKWRVRELEVAVLGGEGVLLTSDGAGRWRDEHGEEVEALAGCIDVDVSVTPFTNTIPIRRLALREGSARDIRVVYVEVPSLERRAVEQRYTCLQQSRRYRYEGYPEGFSAELTVDQDGLVTDYPGLFERVL